MKKNIGTADRIIRVIVAVIVGILYYKGIIFGTLGIVLLIAAGVLLLTSFVSFCPIYKLFGINSCAIKEKNK
ncbi:MAG TPA: DUF2892 domain-containing protein [Edaphocola sp.]|nr:DUF2892 domain-containing protein [Edaphocola sp.]